MIGTKVGECETEAFQSEFVRGLVARGLVGVQLAISDAHQGLKGAIAKVLSVPWERCTVHFLKDCLGHACHEQHRLLGALIRPIFGADPGEEARARLADAVTQLHPPAGLLHPPTAAVAVGWSPARTPSRATDRR